jgi:hypothetical protein
MILFRGFLPIASSLNLCNYISQPNIGKILGNRTLFKQFIKKTILNIQKLAFVDNNMLVWLYLNKG